MFQRPSYRVTPDGQNYRSVRGNMALLDVTHTGSQNIQKYTGCGIHVTSYVSGLVSAD